MNRMKLALVALSIASLSACVVAPYPRPAVYGYPAGGGEVIYADRGPPQPYVEVVPAIPFGGAVWIGGYWGWSGGRHTWVGGRWEQPRAGYRWEPHRWEPAGGGRWQLHGGGWTRR